MKNIKPIIHLIKILTIGVMPVGLAAMVFFKGNHYLIGIFVGIYLMSVWNFIKAVEENSP